MFRDRIVVVHRRDHYFIFFLFPHQRVTMFVDHKSSKSTGFRACFPHDSVDWVFPALWGMSRRRIRNVVLPKSKKKREEMFGVKQTDGSDIN